MFSGEVFLVLERHETFRQRRWSIWTWRDLKKLEAEEEKFEEPLFLKKPFGQILHALEIDKEMSNVYKEEIILAKTVETLSNMSETEFLLNDEKM